ncbi:MAG: bifunctional DNA-formamidopyrimidine glycosylase/DNA-(apurinic or apyrimidinic site) lyase [Gammaproteobacteria bacterium]|nr:bifunctional DNA-formamidopyrimidine glycosylase/DNA-(apurinic or apyrimidinic site) lyase [Gammaproteobacteria bacterium]
MPELPEVETTRRGIAPHILRARVSGVTIRQPRLRWPIPREIIDLLPGQPLQEVGRRGKYLLLAFSSGTLIMHLGMSGSLRILDREAPATKHDHFDLSFANGSILRLRDPRRFGAVLWTGDPAEEHPLLKNLGPEPLDGEFHGAHLHHLGHARQLAIKNLIMDSKVVVGVGNIYANEALFRSGIHPTRPSNRIALPRYTRLAEQIIEVLKTAIEQGGTTLRDFQQEDGRPGYFAQSLQVYGRADQACLQCGSPIKQKTIGQRSSFYCPRCQR